MSPQWMPQNIQKRLLRYVLQQLSLVSEIDLPNLDVSLGTNSKVVLRDLLLDTDKISIPGFYLRDGKVANLALVLAVGGGVNVSASGVELTLLLSTCNVASKKNQFSLAQSTMDLANSMILDRYDDDVVDDDDTSTEDSIPPDSTGRLNGMMSRAAELALSRLKLDLSDITVSVISETCTVKFHIDSVEFNSSEGVRMVNFQGIELVLAGDETVNEDDNDADNDLGQSFDHESYDHDNDHDDDLSSSMMFSHEEASTLYMSATSNFAEDPSSFANTKKDPLARLLHINEAKVSFQGFQNFQDLNVCIDQIHVSLVPLPSFLSDFLQVMKKLSKMKELEAALNRTKQPQPQRLNIRIDLGLSEDEDTSRNRKNNDNSNDNDNDNNAGDLILLENVSVNELVVDLNSSLNANGAFSDIEEDAVQIVWQSIKFIQEDLDSYKGIVEILKIVQRGGVVVLQLDQEVGIDEADLVLQITKGKLIDFAVSKPLKVYLTSSSTAQIVKFVNSITPLLDQLPSSNQRTNGNLRTPIDPRRYNVRGQLNGNRSNDRPGPDAGSKTVFQTESFHISLELTPEMSVEVIMTPLKFTSDQGLLSLDQIMVSVDIQGVKTQLGHLNKAEFWKLSAEELVRVFGIANNSQFEVSQMTTLSKLIIDSIELNSDLAMVTKLAGNWTKFNKIITDKSKDSSKPRSISLNTNVKQKKKVRMTGTTIFHKSLSHYGTLNSLKVSLSGIKDEFGTVELHLQDISLNVFKDARLYQLFVMNGVFTRKGDDGLDDVFFKIANSEDNKSPIIGVKIRESNVVNVCLRNVIVEYYTSWLKYFESSNSSPSEQTQDPHTSKTKLEIRTSLSDAVIGLNPGNLRSKALIVVRKGNLDTILSSRNTIHVSSSLKTLSVLLIDNIDNILSDSQIKQVRQWNGNAPSWSQVSHFILKGFVYVAGLNTVHSNIAVNGSDPNLKKTSSIIDMKINSDWWKIDLCADSAQCLIQLLKDLKQPVNITFDDKYKPSTGALVNVFNDIEDFAFGRTADENQQSSSTHPSMVESYYGSQDIEHMEVPVEGNAQEEARPANGVLDYAENIVFDETHFDSPLEDEAASAKEPVLLPMTIHFAALKLVLNLYDGYDWKETRKTIAGLIKKVQHRAEAELETASVQDQSPDAASHPLPPRRAHLQRRRDSFGEMGFVASQEDEVEDDDFDFDAQFHSPATRLVGETLYDSIVLTMPVGEDSKFFADRINRVLGGKSPDTGSVNSNESSKIGTSKEAANIDLGSKYTGKKLRLRRSKFQKISIELADVEFDMIVFTTYDPTRDPPRAARPQTLSEDDNTAETINRMEIKIRDFVVLDNVPTSTWNRFATYMNEAGIRELGVSMLEMAIDTIRPVAELLATELVLDVKVLPLSLHVDQDSLDFLARFGEFKDERFLLEEVEDDIIFIQKFSINLVKIKLDYKPKKIDYNGIRSGHTSEFMNFFILDEAEMVLRKISLYGVSGFPRLNKLLNDNWMPDIKSTQLSGVLAGLAPVRSIVKLGAGFKDLVAVPITEYKKDKRLLRSLQQGAFVFASSTSNELLKFGVKVAAGTQTVLENAEGALGGEGSSGRLSSFNNSSGSDQAETLYAITDVKTLQKLQKRTKKKPIEASLIGLSAYLDPMESHALQRRGYSHSQRVLDSFEEMADSEDEDALDEDAFSIGEHADSLADDDNDNDESQKVVSLYADQPHNVREGLQAAYDSLGRNFSTARDALKTAGVNISEANGAKAALMAVLKATPVAVMRPIIGTTEAISKLLLGGMNQLDPSQRLKSEEKYKSAK